MRLIRNAWPILLLVVLVAPRARADIMPTSRAMEADTIAQIAIDEGRIGVELEIGMASLDAFHNVLPDEILERLGRDAAPFADRFARFVTEDWVIRREDGAPLVPRIESMEGRPRVQRDEVTGEPIAMAENETVLHIVLEYELPDRPRTLTIAPPTGARAGTNIGFVVEHRGLAVNDFRYLGKPETLDLDWDDPWYSAFRNRNLRRYFAAPLNAFLYVEALEVRKEVVVRPLDLAAWLDLDLDENGVIAAADRPAIEQRVAAFLRDRCPVVIDGETIEPILDRVHFIERSLRTTAVVAPGEDVPVVSALLGVIFRYPITGLPQQVTMDWELFSDRIDSVDTVATDEAGGLPWTVTPEDPVLTWRNFLKNPTRRALVDLAPPPAPPVVPIPLLSVLAGLGVAVALLRWRRTGAARTWRPLAVATACAAIGVATWPFARITPTVPFTSGARLSDAAAEDLVAGLLRNVYHAFDYREENDIYDTLARSASGDLLTQVYLETKGALELRNQGGARARIEDVEILASKTSALPGDPGFESTCTWIATGSVGHWGHIHQRRNQYEAVFTVRPVDGAWKITALELLSEDRL